MRASAPARPARRSTATRASVIVVVLAAGKGLRMKSRIPKVLHPVAGRPMLLWSLNAARSLDPERVLVVTNPEHDGVQAVVDGEGETVPQREQLGTGHALSQVAAGHRTAGPVVVMYADTPLLRGETLQRLLQEHRRSSASVTLLTATLSDPGGYGRVVRGRNGLFRQVVEEREATEAQKRVTEVNAGVYCFSGGKLWPALSRLENRNQAGEYYLTDVLALVSGKVHTLQVEDPTEVLGINDRVQLAEAEAILRKRTLTRLMKDGVTITDPQSTFVDAEVEIGRDSVVHPFTTITGQSRIGEDCVIGPYSQVRDCAVGDGCRVERAHLERATLGRKVVVGPFARLRPGTEIQEGARVGTHTEIKNSRIGPDSTVPHFSYVGDSQLGAGVNIGAGTVTANWDGREHHQTEIGDRTQVGSDTILVAPVRLGSDVYTGAGSVITKDVPAGALAVERTEQRTVEGWTGDHRSRKEVGKQ